MPSDHQDNFSDKSDERVFLQALSHVSHPLEVEQPLPMDPLERENLFKVCQIIGSYSNIKFASSHELLVEGDNLIAVLTLLTKDSDSRFRTVILNGEWWKQESNHMLAFKQDDLQPVALIREKNSYVMIDPKTEEKITVTKDIANTLVKQAFVFYAVFSKNEDYPWKKALRILFTGCKKDLLLYLLFFLMSAALGLIMPFINKTFFDYVIPYLDTSLFYQVIGALLIAAFASSLMVAATSSIKLKVTAYIATRMQAIIWTRVFELSPAFFRSMPTGDVLQRVSLLETFQAEINKNIIRTISSGILSVIYLIPMFYYSWQLSGIVFAFVAVSFFIFVAFIPKLFMLNLSLMRIGASIGGALIQMISGITDIRIFRAEKKGFAYWSRFFVKGQKIGLEAKNLSNYLLAGSQSISMVMILVVYGALVLLYQDANGFLLFSIGSFMAFRSAMSTFVGEASSLIGVLIDTQNLFAHWVRVRKIWRGKRKPDFKGLTPNIQGNVRASQLVFRYEKESNPVIRDLSLKIDEGKFTAIIGPSGCGKSTLLRLFTGIEVPKSGTITYDNIPIEDIEPLIFKEQVSAILQTSKIFSGSVLENILCGRKAELDEIEDAIKISSLKESLKEFPLGLSTPLPIGGELLSNGQRQRLLLARALLKKPKVLFLDEATSAIDNHTEMRIVDDLLQREVTLCLVTHQPYLLQKADKIYQLEKGTVVKEGTYNDFFKKTRG